MVLTLGSGVVVLLDKREVSSSMAATGASTDGV